MKKLIQPARIGALAAMAALGLGLAACSGGGGAKSALAHTVAGTAGMAGMDMPATASPLSGPAIATNKVTILNFAFMPRIITVHAGQTVTWTNMDEEPHTVTDGNDGINSTVLGNQGSTFSYTFTKAGSYSYNCSIHPFMHGMVVVTA